jgi:toxin CcdB
MGQFDIHRFRSRTTAYSYVVDVQQDFLDPMETRLVIPAVRVTAADIPLRRLNPLLDIEGVQHYLRTQELAAVRRRLLGEVIGSARPQGSAIISAIDMLITG